MNIKPWTEVTARINKFEEIEAIHQWCRDNCKGSYNIYGVPATAIRRARFESVDDAILFALRWA
jgi:hypothetical protein